MKNENGEYSETIIICFLKIFQETSLKIKIKESSLEIKALSNSLTHPLSPKLSFEISL